MSFTEKANLIFANFNRQRGNGGKDSLLTSEEEKVIFDDCRLKDQLRKMNRLIVCYNLLQKNMTMLASFIVWFDLQTSHVRSFSFLMCFISEKDEEGLNDECSWIEPSKDEAAGEPNIDFQKMFQRVLEAYKFIQERLYMIEILQRRGEGVCFSDDRDFELIGEAKKKLMEVEMPDASLFMIGIYREVSERGLMRKSGFFVPEFEEFLFHPEKALELKEKDKEKCEETVRSCLENN